jgi:clan AA aspartic protease (TIGR02281 family)
MPANSTPRHAYGAAPFYGSPGYSRPAPSFFTRAWRWWHEPVGWRGLAAAFAVPISFLALLYQFGDWSTLPQYYHGHGEIDGHGEIKAEIDGSGHCWSTAWAAAGSDGGDFSVMLDSGAGAPLWLTRKDAARVGINVGSLNFNHSYRGMSGAGWAAYVRLAQFRLGGLVLSDLPAYVVSETDGVNTALVGLPILRQLNYRVVDGSCVLSW